MSPRKPLNGPMAPGLHAFIVGRRGSGRNGTVSEVVRAALGLLREREPQFDELRMAAIEAVDLDEC